MVESVAVTVAAPPFSASVLPTSDRVTSGSGSLSLRAIAWVVTAPITAPPPGTPKVTITVSSAS